MVTKFDSSFKLNEEQIAALKQIIPEAFKDGFVDIGALSDALSDYTGENILDIDENLFGLYWPGKRTAKRAAAVPPLGTLVPVPGDGVNEETTRNIYIEGDNLEVLKIIKKAYTGKIKMIYIDPPYNTGNDFIYNDDFSETEESYKKRTGQIDESGEKTTTNNKSDGRFHSKWCSMMYPRLRLARELLSDDGVIFISIDDNEVAQLRKICDEIFGEDNFVTEFAWEKKKKPSFLHKNIGKLNDYIICYVKDTFLSGPFSVEKTTVGKKYPFNNAGNGISILSFPAGYVEFGIPDGIIEPQNMSEGNIVTELLDTIHIRNKRNIDSFRLKGEWRYSQNKLDDIVKNNESILISKIPFRPNHVKEGGEIKKMKNVLSPTHYQMETNEDASAQLTDLFGFAIFDNPKPIKLLNYLTLAVTYNSSNSIILDFFSGSATTAHAVMQLNAEDGGNRQFIMVQLPEICKEDNEATKSGFKNICEIGKERIRKAGEKIRKDNLDTGFKVFRLAPSNIKSVKPYTGTNINELSDLFSGDPLVDGWKPENLISEVMLKEGFPLDSRITKLDIYKKNKVFQVSSDSCDHSLIICFDKNIESDTVEKLDLGELNIFICLDSAITDQVKARLDDKGRIITI